MSNSRLVALDYIRAISMLGVIGIHTGAYSLSYSAANPHLFALYEIVSRFSVPIFFFVSAFGLFLSQPLNKEFHYPTFMSKRFRTVLLPYLTWSLLYMLHYTWLSGDTTLWQGPLVFKYLLLGLASYQLYFLVILIWFYALMPLWRILAAWLVKNITLGLTSLLLGQIAFNYYSSYILRANFENHYLNLAIEHRMSYLVLHYLFIFLLGAVCAERFSQFQAYLKQKSSQINFCFLLTLAGMLIHYYYLVYYQHYSLESAVNTVHQLSPLGVLYTASAALFWFKIFSGPLPDKTSALLTQFGKHSYVIYLVHPFVMYYLLITLNKISQELTPLTTVFFYLTTLAASFCLSWIIEKISRHLPLLGLLLTGSSPAKTKLTAKL
ncbi:MAG: Acyltransferase family protein [Firmicutes bacterium]|nr:Acyltransferase family protein [Bacillota bacterium]